MKDWVHLKESRPDSSVYARACSAFVYCSLCIRGTFFHFAFFPPFSFARNDKDKTTCFILLIGKRGMVNDEAFELPVICCTQVEGFLYNIHKYKTLRIWRRKLYLWIWRGLFVLSDNVCMTFCLTFLPHGFEMRLVWTTDKKKKEKKTQTKKYCCCQSYFHFDFQPLQVQSESTWAVNSQPECWLWCLHTFNIRMKHDSHAMPVQPLLCSDLITIVQMFLSIHVTMSTHNSDTRIMPPIYEKNLKYAKKSCRVWTHCQTSRVRKRERKEGRKKESKKAQKRLKYLYYIMWFSEWLMKCISIWTHKWISNEMIHHLISGTNRACTTGRLGLKVSSPEF